MEKLQALHALRIIIKRCLRGISVVLLLAAVSGCAALPMAGTDGPLPPVLVIEEIKLPYNRIGRINVTRTVYVSDYVVPSALHEWAHQTLREEAGKLDADGVILPEISSREVSIFIFPAFPATEYRAAGVAIKFVK